MKKQQGAITLLMALMMVIIITGMTFMTGAAMKEQTRLTSDDWRDRQAYEAAQAGLADAMTTLYNDLSGDIYNTNIAGNSATGGSYTAVWCEPTSVPTRSAACVQKVFDPDEGRVLIHAIGISDDGTAERHITAIVAGRSAFTAGASAPVSGGNGVTIGGSTAVTNQYGRTSIWSGGTVTLGNNKETLVLAPQEDVFDARRVQQQILAGDNSEAMPDMVIGSDDSRSGADIVDEMVNLRNASVSDFYQHFLGTTEASYQGIANIFSTGGNNPDFVDSDGNALSGTIQEKEQELCDAGIVPRYYISGDVNLNKGDIGTHCPVSLIVSGDLSIGGNTEFTGLLFVEGNLDSPGAGTFNIDGGLVMHGELNVTGDLVANYNPFTLSELNGEASEIAIIPGSWKDWIDD